MKYELFIAIGDAAETYSSGFNVKELENAINNDFAPSLIHKVFETEAEKKAFQDGLEVAAECSSFYVICDDDVNNNRELIESLV